MITFDPTNEDDIRLAHDCWQTFNDDGSWWTCHFLRLCAKSDTVHTDKLRSVFPREVAMYELWMATDQDEFAERFNIPRRRQ